jgi:protein disulfide-isomerase A1
LKPIWDSLGEHFKDVKDQITMWVHHVSHGDHFSYFLFSAKMEATENDIPPSAPFRVGGFPTLKFKPAGSKEFIDYNGDRSLENLIAFVEENAKNSLKPTFNDTPPAQQPLKVESEAHDEL